MTDHQFNQIIQLLKEIKGDLPEDKSSEIDEIESKVEKVLSEVSDSKRSILNAIKNI